MSESRGINASKAVGTRDSLLTEEMADRLGRIDPENSVTNTATIAGSADLTQVPWSTVPHYGPEHGRYTAQLSVRVGQFLNLSPNDLEVVRTAALYHDLGRTAPFRVAEPAHARHSAALAENHLRSSSAWAQGEFIDQVCRLIAAHALPPVDTPVGALKHPKDPRLQALWDADALEAARFEPNTASGLLYVRARYAHLVTPWAQLPEHRNRWRKYRGWN